MATVGGGRKKEIAASGGLWAKKKVHKKYVLL